jgi:translocator protein
MGDDDFVTREITITKATTTAIATTLGAAVLGNSLIRREDLAWLAELDRPAMQISVPKFAVVGGLYYLALGSVLYRATDHRDTTTARLAMVVLVLNEAWNVAFFRRRSARNGFWGILAFCLPLGALQVSVRRDKTASLVLAPYSAWVVCYDVPWTYQLWRLNRPDHRQDGHRS